MNVVDLGSASWGKETSVPKLAERFDPELIFGFDPLGHSRSYHVGDTLVIEDNSAAWTFDGRVSVVSDTTASHVTDGQGLDRKCFDLARFLGGLPDPVVVKMDVEGAEHVLLPHVFADPLAASKVRLLLIEWHGKPSFEIPCAWEAWS